MWCWLSDFMLWCTTHQLSEHLVVYPSFHVDYMLRKYGSLSCWHNWITETTHHWQKKYDIQNILLTGSIFVSKKLTVPNTADVVPSFQFMYWCYLAGMWVQMFLQRCTCVVVPIYKWAFLGFAISYLIQSVFSPVITVSLLDLGTSATDPVSWNLAISFHTMLWCGMCQETFPQASVALLLHICLTTETPDSPKLLKPQAAKPFSH